MKTALILWGACRTPKRQGRHILTGSTKTGDIKHPAMFPEQLAHGHILSWSDPEDIVYDPFMGSGTTCMAAVKTGRKCIGSEISKKYADVARNRINLEITRRMMDGNSKYRSNNTK
jgi:DNA modification methylase